MTLGEKIKAGRKRRKMTQQALADAIGVSRSTIARIEAGEVDVSIDTARRLVRARIVTAVVLLAEER